MRGHLGILPVSVFLTLACGALFVFPVPEQTAATAADAREEIELMTLGEPAPLVLSDGQVEFYPTTIAIRAALDRGGSGTGVVTLDERRLDFNDFGDATRSPGTSAKKFKVTLRQADHKVAGDGRRLFEIAFEGGVLTERLKLVLSDGANGPHRLLLYDGNRKENRVIFATH